MTNEKKYFRLYLKGLHVGVGVRAERVEIDRTSVWFWDGFQMVASFWREDVTRLRQDGVGELPLATGAELALALTRSLQEVA